MTKKTSLLFIAAFFLSACGKKSGDFSGPLNSFKRYPYEDFHISYEISGDGRGTEEIYVSGYGKYEAQYSKTEIFGSRGISQEDHTLITKVADVYAIDNLQRVYVHNHVNGLDSLFHLDAKDIPTPAQFTEAEMKNNLLKNTGQDSIAGKIALRWQLTDGNLTMWTWNGILLKKFAGSGENNITMMIKNFDSTWVVDTTKFMIPGGYKEDRKSVV